MLYDIGMLSNFLYIDNTAMIKIPALQDNNMTSEYTFVRNQKGKKYSQDQSKRAKCTNPSRINKSHLLKWEKIHNTIEDWEEEVKSLPLFKSTQRLDNTGEFQNSSRNNITNAETPFIQNNLCGSKMEELLERWHQKEQIVGNW